jgi:hypothetical protein
LRRISARTSTPGPMRATDGAVTLVA